MRFRVLIELPSGDDFISSKQIIELKEIPKSLRRPMPDGASRLDKTIDNMFEIIDPRIKRFYGVDYGKNQTDYLIRPR